MRSIYDFIIKPVGERYDNTGKGWRSGPNNEHFYRKF